MSVDVVICTDRIQFPGVLALLRSALTHSAQPESIFFHLVVSTGEAAHLRDQIRRHLPDLASGYEIREFATPPFLKSYLRTADFQQYGLAHTSVVMNYARFYLPEIFPRLGKVAYVDADVIVAGKIEQLLEEATLAEHLLAAVPILTWGEWQGGADLEAASLSHIDAGECLFNAGVYVTDLAAWRRQHILSRVEEWIEAHRRRPQDFVFGTQAILNLVFYRDFQHLPPEWNVRPLGNDPNIPERTLRRAQILHWAGRHKPWNPDGLYRQYWAPYAP